MKKRKLKKSVVFMIICLAAVVGISIFLLTRPINKNDKENHAQMIQNGANLEIIVPEEMGDGGF